MIDVKFLPREPTFSALRFTRTCALSPVFILFGGHALIHGAMETRSMGTEVNDGVSCGFSLRFTTDLRQCRLPLTVSRMDAVPYGYYLTNK